MSRIPNSSPQHQGNAPARQQSDRGGLHMIDAGPAVADAPAGHQRPNQPAQMPLLHNPGQADEVGFLTDQQFVQDYLKEDHTLPIVTLIACAGITLAIYGYKGLAAGGVGGALGMCLLAVILLAVAALTATAAGWVVCKVFGENTSQRV